MDRVTRRIVGYVAVVGLLAAAVFFFLPWPPGWLHLVVAALFLLPGRLQGVLWRDFFRGRHAMNRQDFAGAEKHFLLFLDKLKQRPRLRHAAFLAWNFYTWNPEAMTRSNLGACRLVLGKLDAAEPELKEARDLDPGSPLPYFNLAVLAHARGAESEAERLRALAAQFGYRAATRERLISAAGGALAAVEGRF
jgi:tetratricopeptide (TPR) repeat protein